MRIVDFVLGVSARARSLWRGVRGRSRVEAEMAEEMRHHVELRTEDLLRRGVPAADAARRARREFGSMAQHREQGRAARGLRLVDELGFSWLDVKLGVRMLVKYPALSIVSVLGMSVAIAVAAGGFGFIQAMMDPTLPLHDGERIVSVQNNDARNIGNPDRQTLHLFEQWRESVATIEHLSAVNLTSRTLVVPGGEPVLVRVAEMTASGFDVTRVAPVLGRALIEEDEQAGAAPVVVIGESEWRRRFDADPAVIGRTVRLGTTLHTVVGVMPSDYRFPVSHQYWVPLRIAEAQVAPGEGPVLHLFGRLADGVTLERARAELATLGARAASTWPDAYGHVRPQVLRYTHAYMDVDSPVMAVVLRLFQLALALVLVVVSVNVGALVYARTTTRMGEIAVRSALGASRRRVVAQLFAEALVLSSTAAAIGLGIAAGVLGGIQRFQQNAVDWEWPFWLELGLSPSLVAYVAGLAILGGVIVGVAPALKATGRSIQPGLQQLSSRGSRIQLGRTWTALIVAQVAITVAVLPFALYIAMTSALSATSPSGFASDQVLRSGLAIEQEEHPNVEDVAAYRASMNVRFRALAAELLRRLEAEPGVAGVSYATRFPGTERWASIEDERGGESIGVASSDVDVDILDVLGVPLIAGRNFRPGDAREGGTAVIVTQTLADQLGGAVIGRQIRFLKWVQGGEPERGPWHEIVGIVPDFTVPLSFEPEAGKIYRASDVPDTYAMDIALRIPGDAPMSFAPRLRELAADVDPALQLSEIRTAENAEHEVRAGLKFTAAIGVACALSVLLLSAAGIHAMIAFTVGSRRREIGIRSALGAGPRRVLAAILARAAAQLGTGVGIGIAVAVMVKLALGEGVLAGRSFLYVPGTAALLLTVGLLAALGPARRGLAIQPTEALKED